MSTYGSSRKTSHLSFDLHKSLVWCPVEAGWRRLVDLGIEDGYFNRVLVDDDLLPIEYADGHRYLFPGLIDSHVHIAEDPTLANGLSGSCEKPRIFTDTLDQTFHRVLRNLKTAARAGITTLRDMGNLKSTSLEFVCMLEDERKAGTILPRVFSAGGFLTRQGGHACDRGIEAPTLQSLVETIRQLARDGASFIKLMNDPIVFDSQELLEARTVTRKLGLPLVVHTYTDDAARLAVDAQVDVIEHPGAYSDSTMAMIKRDGIFVVSTFIAALDTVVDPVGCGADTLFPDANLTIFKDWYLGCCDYIPKLFGCGVQLLCGTDAGFPGTDFNSLSREMVALEMLGVPLSEAVKSATIYGAKALRREGLLGEVKEGAYADYLVFDKNPLTGNQRLKHPAAVYCGGQRVV